MSDFFEDETEDGAITDNSHSDSSVPLAAKMRPRKLNEYIGQEHILRKGKLLRRAIEADRFASLIFYGLQVVGKTSLAKVISNYSKSRFLNLSGVESNVAEIRRSVESAESLNRLVNQQQLYFVDEIHQIQQSPTRCSFTSY